MTNNKQVIKQLIEDCAESHLPLNEYLEKVLNYSKKEVENIIKIINDERTQR